MSFFYLTHLLTFTSRTALKYHITAKMVKQGEEKGVGLGRGVAQSPWLNHLMKFHYYPTLQGALSEGKSIFLSHQSIFAQNNSFFLRNEEKLAREILKNAWR